jgi:hypothetical protein
MATNLVNEPHKAIPSIFRLTRNTPSPAIKDRHNGTAAIFFTALSRPLD